MTGAATRDHLAARAEFSARGWHFTSKVRVAARYVGLTNCSWNEAALAIDVGCGGVWMAYRRIYGTNDRDLKIDLRRDKRTTRSRCAVRYRELVGCTFREAAVVFGLNPVALANCASQMREHGELPPGKWRRGVAKRKAAQHEVPRER